MKNSTYETISMIAVAALVVFTVSAQRSNHGYLFGVLAMLTAAGMFATYVKALPQQAGFVDPVIKSVENVGVASVENVGVAEVPPRDEVFIRSVHAGLHRYFAHTELERAKELHEALYKERLSEIGIRIFDKAIFPDLKAANYYTLLGFRHEPVPDVALVVTNIVERLCASSKEPRFEFILGPDGSFKIKQVHAKWPGFGSTTRDEQPEPIEQSTESQVIN